MFYKANVSPIATDKVVVTPDIKTDKQTYKQTDEETDKQTDKTYQVAPAERGRWSKHCCGTGGILKLTGFSDN